LLVVALVALMPGTGSLVAQDRPDPSMLAARAALLRFAQKDVEGFASAREPWRFSFPQDHAVHPEYRTETWRFSGSVASPEGERFGFQLTFFRVGVVPPATPLGPSIWAARDVYWGQFSISDAAAGRQYHSERMERSARGRSGANAQPAGVWLEDWRMEVRDADARTATFALHAAQERIGLELSLQAAKPPVTRTAEEAQSTIATNFHAYMVTRLVAKGSIRIDNRVLDVRGIAWLDRAWGEVPLPVGAVVWDRFLVHLADGRDIMGLRLRRRDGSAAPIISGVMVERDGVARLLAASHLAIHPVERRWRLHVPDEGLALDLIPYVSSSGAARVSGLGGSEAHGFIETAADLETGTRR
jgi:predicted secreted hydrolase